MNDNTKRHMMITDDNKLNFMCGFNPEPIGNAGLIADNKEYISLNKVDYMLETNPKISMEISDEPEPEIILKTKEDIPIYDIKKDTEDKQKTLSYLSVKSVEEGIEWYQKEFPKLPDELYEMMSRWNFGDLNQITKKELKNKKKKDKKKRLKKDIQSGLKVEQKPVLITFD
tara:strand:- start:294 stop:806 length:513 start_codon:yes stop_codon:yes gene_type:complete